MTWMEQEEVLDPNACGKCKKIKIAGFFHQCNDLSEDGAKEIKREAKKKKRKDYEN